jgi:hypothetical protein
VPFGRHKTLTLRHIAELCACRKNGVPISLLESPHTWPEEETTLLSLPPASVPVLEVVPRVPLPEALDPVAPEGLYGLLTLADGIELGMRCVIVREEGGSDRRRFRKR